MSHSIQDLEETLECQVVEVRNVGRGLDSRLLRCFPGGNVKPVIGVFTSMRGLSAQDAKGGLMIIVRRSWTLAVDSIRGCVLRVRNVSLRICESWERMIDHPNV